MKKLNKRELILGVLTVALLFFFMVIQNIIKPMQAQSDTVLRKAQMSQSKYMKLRRTVAQGPAVAQRYARLVDVLGTAGPANEEMSSLVSKLQLLASEYSLRVGQIQPQRAADNGDVVFYPVQMHVNGKWSDLARFLARVQSGPDHMFIVEMSLQKNVEPVGSIAGLITLSRMRLKSVL